MYDESREPGRLGHLSGTGDFECLLVDDRSAIAVDLEREAIRRRRGVKTRQQYREGEMSACGVLLDEVAVPVGRCDPDAALRELPPGFS